MSDDQSLQDTVSNGLPDRVTSVTSLVPPVPAIGFWLAIGLPVFYIPFLLVGVDGPRKLGLFFGLLGLHLVALYAGRSYRPG